MKTVLVEKKSGACLIASTCTDQDVEMFASSFMNDDFKAQYGEPDIQYDPDFNIERIQQLRQSAYQAESDPLYMEWQYDQSDAKKQAWVTAVKAIKTRYPLPSETTSTKS